MIRHLSARHEVTSRRSRARPRKRRKARAWRRTARATIWRRSAIRCRRCGWCCACRRRRRRRSDISIRRSSHGASTHCSPSDTLRPDLRALLVGRAVRRERPRHAQDPRLRRHGLAEVARVRALQALSAVARLPARRHQDGARRKAARSPLRPVHGDDAGRMGDARELSAPASPRTGFPNGVDSEYFAPSGEPYDADTIAFVGRMDYYPNQECMFDFCARTLPLLHARRPSLKLVIVGADPSPRVQRLGAASRRHRHRFGRRRAAVPAPLGADGRAAQHRARHAEQDPRGDGDRRSGRDQPRRRRRRRRRRSRAFPGRVDARRIRRGNPAHPRRSRRAATPVARGPRTDAVASRLGQVDAAARRHHRALSCAIRAGRRARRARPTGALA